MNPFQQGLSELVARMVGQVPGQVARMVSQAPAQVARKLPGWIAGGAKAYVRWLWQLDTVMKFVMFAFNVAALQIAVHSLPGPHADYAQIGQLGAIALAFFLIASLLFGRRQA
jgi:hypothetical protein